MGSNKCWLPAAVMAVVMFSSPAQAGAMSQKVVTDSVTLLNTEQEFAARIAQADLVSFIRLVESVAHQTLAANGAPAQVVVQFDCAPGRTSIRISSQGKADTAVLQALHQQLSKANPLATKGDVSFQVNFRVK